MRMRKRTGRFPCSTNKKFWLIWHEWHTWHGSLCYHARCQTILIGAVPSGAAQTYAWKEERERDQRLLLALHTRLASAPPDTPSAAREKENKMITAIKEKFRSNPKLYYALSICATWAGIGSLMNGVTMTKTYGVLPSLIWVLGNTLACILFGCVAMKIPKVREVFGSRVMKWICGIMCVFQAWLSMNGMQTVFADTPLGADFGMGVAYALAVLFLLILLRFGMIRNVLTDGAGWLIVYLLAVAVTITAAVHSRGAYHQIPLIQDAESMRQGIWKAILLLPGPFTYPYFFEILNYNDGNDDGTAKVNVKQAFILGGIFFGLYMAIIFPLAWTNFTPALNVVKAVLITIIGTSTLSSSMYSIYIAFGKKIGLAINAGLIVFWSVLIPLGVMGMWTLMASVRIYFVCGGILAALLWNNWEKRKAVIA